MDVAVPSGPPGLHAHPAHVIGVVFVIALFSNGVESRRPGKVMMSHGSRRAVYMRGGGMIPPPRRRREPYVMPPRRRKRRPVPYLRGGQRKPVRRPANQMVEPEWDDWDDVEEWEAESRPNKIYSAAYRRPQPDRRPAESQRVPVWRQPASQKYRVWGDDAPQQQRPKQRRPNKGRGKPDWGQEERPWTASSYKDESWMQSDMDDSWTSPSMTKKLKGNGKKTWRDEDPWMSASQKQTNVWEEDREDMPDTVRKQVMYPVWTDDKQPSESFQQPSYIQYNGQRSPQTNGKSKRKGINQNIDSHVIHPIKNKYYSNVQKQDDEIAWGQDYFGNSKTVGDTWPEQTYSNWHGQDDYYHDRSFTETFNDQLTDSGQDQPEIQTMTFSSSSPLSLAPQALAQVAPQSYSQPIAPQAEGSPQSSEPQVMAQPQIRVVQVPFQQYVNNVAV